MATSVTHLARFLAFLNVKLIITPKAKVGNGNSCMPGKGQIKLDKIVQCINL